MEDIKSALEKCKTAGEMLDVLLRSYYLDKPLGPATKMVFISGLLQAIRMVQAVRKF
jgi:hypothetical protein